MSTNDVVLVRLIARRYRALQGLRTAIDAVALLLLWSLLQIPGASRRSGPYVIAVVVWAVLATWGESKGRGSTANVLAASSGRKVTIHRRRACCCSGS